MKIAEVGIRVQGLALGGSPRVHGPAATTINTSGIKATIKDPITGVSETVGGGFAKHQGFRNRGTWRATNNFTLWRITGYANSEDQTTAARSPDIARSPPGTAGRPRHVAAPIEFRRLLNGLSLH